jgi:clan AA aspartic protease (TIGR02281 family)
MLKLNFLIFLFVCFISKFSAQTTVKLTQSNGVFVIPCKVNSVVTNFIFDTGASTVTISKKYFDLALQNGTIKKSDILPEVLNFQIANGDVIEGSMVNIRSFEIGNYLLTNVLATVIESQSEDLLLGQTVLQRFGTYSIDNQKNELVFNAPGSELFSDIEQDYFMKGKNTGWDEATTKKIYGQHIISGQNAIEFCKTATFEMYEIRLRNKEDGELDFEYDITNNSMYNVTGGGYGIITIIIEIITTDGKTYSTSHPLTEPLLSGRTIEGPRLSMKIRNKEPKYIRVYCKYQDIVLNKYY